MFATARRRTAVLVSSMIALAVMLMGMGLYHQGLMPSTAQVPAGVVTTSGYDISVFAKGTSAYSHPDSVDVDVAKQYVYIGYQNITAKDGTDHKFSTIVQYSYQGKVLHTYSVPGHCDGMRVDQATHYVWATSNEDGNPGLVIINPATGVVKPYHFAPTPHAGGYDDLVILHGMTFIAASNPSLNSQGVNVFPAVDKLTLRGSNVVLTPVLFGNATATDQLTNQKVSLNMTDPDSMSIDPQGNLVQADQADAQLIFLHNAGTSTQTVSRLTVGTQIDDTAWATSPRGHLIVVDGKSNTTYLVSTGFVPGTIYTEAPSDSGVAGFVGTIDPKTGIITPIIIGLGSPTGLLFLPES